MPEASNHHQSGRGRNLFTATLLITILALYSAGCGDSTDTSRAEPGYATPVQAELPATLPDSRVSGEPIAEDVAFEVLPMPENLDGPTIADEYPGLASDGLMYARLVDLPDGVVLQSSVLQVTQAEIDDQIAQVPEEVREQISRNAFFLLEQIATQNLLLAEARQSVDSVQGNEMYAIQMYLQGIVEGVAVNDEEISDFFNRNRAMIGDATLEEIGGQIGQFLLQEKQQEAVQLHVQKIGLRMPVAVSAEWVKAQAVLAMDNPVDKARTGGKPTMVNFGTDSSVPCQMMVPIREAVQEKFEGKANVVYVNVDEEQILASRFGVQGIPMLLFFDAEGREFDRHMGVMSQEEIEERFQQMGVQE